MSTRLLEVRRLAVGYAADRPVLSGIDFGLDGGQLTAVVAPNGSGKSTLLKTIAGGLPPLSGTVDLEGRPLQRFSRRQLAQRVAMVAVDEPLYQFTVEQIVSLGRYPHIGRLAAPGPADRQAVEQALLMMGLIGLRHRQFEQLSLGERQKVTLARIIAQQPRLMLLDEITAHLDLANQYSVMRLIRQMVDDGGVAVLAVLHDLTLAAGFADRVLMFHRGGLVADGRPDEVITPDNLKRLFDLPGELCQRLAARIYDRTYL
ncbi:MAG: ABC transporter ATP-binding protein [Negativicutes bacterium]|nr:ABC transporter ATP-binding protein [Negativicutes bacterium]